MLLLLRTELQANANLFLTEGGRRDLLGMSITMVCTAFGAMLIFRKILEYGEGKESDPLQGLELLFLGLTLVPAIFLSMTLVLHSARSGLFERPEAELVLTSPVPPRVGVGLVFLRSLVTCILFSIPLTLPTVAMVCNRFGLGLTPVFLAPVVLLIVLVPVIAPVVMVQIILMRWFASPRMKVLLQGIGALVTATFALLGMLGLLADDDQVEGMVEKLSASPGLFESMTGPAQLLLLGQGPIPSATTWLSLVALVFVPLMLMNLAARLYPRAHENSVVSGRPLWRTKTRSPGETGIRWPVSVASSVARRDLAHNLQEPGALFVYLFLAGLIIWAMISSFGEIESKSLPVEINRLFQILSQSSMILLILGMLITPSLYSEELRQRPLLATSPASPRSLFFGRIPGLSVPYVVCWLVSVVTAVALGQPIVTVLLFILISLPIIAISLGGVMAIATIPLSWGGSKKSPGAEIAAVVGPQLGVGAVQAGVMIGVYWFRSRFSDFYRGEGLFASGDETTLVVLVLVVVVLGGLCLGWLGFEVGAWNLRRSLRPARD